MTRNQIEVMKLRQTQKLTDEANRITEQQNKREIAYKYDALRETERHNRASLDEVTRHNVATEGQQYVSLTEQQRHNVANEALTAAAQSEQHRANLARETEQHRSATAAEELQRARNAEDVRYHNASIELGKYQAGAAYRNVDLGFANLAEQTRSHQAQEQLSAIQLAETATHNRNVEAETRRTNIAKENLQTSDLQLQKDRNTETQRHNQQQETLQAIELGVDSVTSVVNSAANVARIALR